MNQTIDDNINMNSGKNSNESNFRANNDTSQLIPEDKELKGSNSHPLSLNRLSARVLVTINDNRDGVICDEIILKKLDDIISQFPNSPTKIPQRPPQVSAATNYSNAGTATVKSLINFGASAFNYFPGTK